MTDSYNNSARVVFENAREMHRETLRVQLEMTKWLLASLLLLHTAALGGILFKQPAPIPVFAIALFVVGVICALGSGFAAWLNAGILGSYFERQADHRMLSNPEHWPKEKASWTITFTRYASIVFGFASLTAWVIGVAVLLGVK